MSTTTTTTTTAAAAAAAVESMNRRFCPVCRELLPGAFADGPNGRPNAVCPKCRGLERHRFLALLLPMLAPRFGAIDTVLDVAPSVQVTSQLRALGPRRYVRMDLGLDSRDVDVLSSLTQLPHPDASIDLIVCYHVLEHVPDDATAMREIARVLKPGGTALIQVPIRLGTVTDEDPDAPEEERLRRFGQADHVRYYGNDFEDRLNAAGLVFQRVSPLDLFGEAVVEWCRLTPREIVWVVWRADGRPQGEPALPGSGAATAMTTLLDTALGELGRSRAQVHRMQGKLAAGRAAGPAQPEPPAGRSASDVVRRVVGAVRRRG